MKILIIIAILTGVLSIAASGTGIAPSEMFAPEDCDISLGEPIVNSNSQDSILIYQEQLCVAAGSLVITFTEWVDGITPTSRPATADEITLWNEHTARLVAAAEMAIAESNLAADVEPGQKWIEKLREWSVATQDYYDQWPTLSDAQKDSVTREMIRRIGLTWGGLADLLTVLGKGK